MSGKPWDAEIVLTTEDARKLIEIQFPQLKPVTIIELGKGFDNTVFNVNNEFVFRFPRRDIAVKLLETENLLLPKIAPALNISIPEPIFTGTPEGDYPWIFIGYKLVKGKVPGALTEAQRLKSAQPLAKFFKKLHSFPVKGELDHFVPKDEFHRLSIERRREKLINNAHKIMDLGLLDQPKLFESFLSELTYIPIENIEVLTHGDPHIRNLLVDEKGIVSGVIDWGDTHIGHPAVDLSIAYSFLSPTGRSHFFDEYGEVSENTKQLAKFKAVYTSALLLLYGYELNEYALLQTAKNSLAFSLTD